MSITAKVYVEHDRLALAPTLRRLDEVDARVVSQGTTDPGTTTFPFLVEYEDRARLERALDDDATVASYELVEWAGGGGIYYIEHTDQTRLISTVVTDANGFLLHTETRDLGWLARLLLPDREALNAVWEYATDEEMRLDIIEIHSNDGMDTEMAYGLTDEQEAALTLAYDRGYFAEPRDVSLEEVATEMGLSSTAMSGRLRRGMRNLIGATIADRDGDRGR